MKAIVPDLLALAFGVATLVLNKQWARQILGFNAFDRKHEKRLRAVCYIASAILTVGGLSDLLRRAF